MKEQAIHGRIFNNLEEVRAAAIAFKDRYNRDWRLEKLGFKSPLEARQDQLIKLAA
jgi:putative transposase